jgi:pimeloyl-ACP methyl ester carboxylesterase
MTEEILDLGDVRLCVEAFGQPDDPTILLISGAAESMDGWDPAWCEELAAAGRRVRGLDLRGISSSGAGGLHLLDDARLFAGGEPGAAVGGEADAFRLRLGR